MHELFDMTRIILT